MAGISASGDGRTAFRVFAAVFRSHYEASGVPSGLRWKRQRPECPLTVWLAIAMSLRAGSSGSRRNDWWAIARPDGTPLAVIASLATPQRAGHQTNVLPMLASDLIRILSSRRRSCDRVACTLTVEAVELCVNSSDSTSGDSVGRPFYPRNSTLSATMKIVLRCDEFRKTPRGMRQIRA